MASFLRFCSALIMVCGFFKGAFCLIELPASEHFTGFIQNGLKVLLFGVVPFYTGLYFYRFYHSQVLKRTEERKELEILKFAAARQGNLTSAEVAVKLNIPVEEAKRVLDKLSYRNILDCKITTKGHELYSITTFAREDKFINLV